VPNYIRYRLPDGCYFFTVNLLERYSNDLLIPYISLLRESVKRTKEKYPFDIDGWVVLPDHMHCIWMLPHGDDNFSTRWRLIKSHFVKIFPKEERQSSIRQKRGERGIWQRRYWEHFIRDNNDYHRHLDYLHYNPVKHGYVRRVADWPYSSFHRWVEKGVYSIEWGAGQVDDLNVGERFDVWRNTLSLFRPTRIRLTS
jgi:putative transposase